MTANCLQSTTQPSNRLTDPQVEKDSFESTRQTRRSVQGTHAAVGVVFQSRLMKSLSGEVLDVRSQLRFDHPRVALVGAVVVDELV